MTTLSGQTPTNKPIPNKVIAPPVKTNTIKKTITKVEEATKATKKYNESVTKPKPKTNGPDNYQSRR